MGRNWSRVTGPIVMPLLQLRQITLKYGDAPLLDQIDFQVEAGERICLLGRNGAGKTSLMRIITGEETPNEGELILPAETKVTRLIQEIPDDITGTVMEVLHSGLRPDRHEEEWQTDVRLEDLAAEDAFADPSRIFGALGRIEAPVCCWRARWPGSLDILLLDEPTNHLDLDSILWLERFLLESKMTLFFVTHDRTFLRKLATRIVELDRGQLTSWACDYDTYLERKAANLEAEEKQWAAFDKKLAQEEAWLRQGVKARRTRNEGRVRALLAMRNERGERRQREGTARIELQTGSMSGQKVIEAKDISFSYGDSLIVSNFTTTVWRGDKIGIIGPNGGGKTTLLKLLLGQLDPESGTVEAGHEHAGRLSRPVARSDRQREDGRAKRGGRCRVTVNFQETRAALSTATCRIFYFPPTASACRRKCFPAVSATGCCWRAFSCSRPTCWCSTSRRTISMPRRSSCSRKFCSSTPARCCSFRMIASFWITS